MTITIFNDVKKFTVVSSIKKEAFDLVKKYAPDTLKIKDKEGNDVFGVSYTENRHSIAKHGVTFGATNDDGNLMFVADIPEGTKDNGEYVADFVGAITANLKAIEANLPEVVSGVKAEREALIAGIKKA